MRTIFFLTLALSMIGALPGAALEPLTVRVSDLEGAPGEDVVIVLRTYSPRALGQGQICLRANQNLARVGQLGGALVGGGSPFVEFLGVEVFAAGGDSVVAGELDPGGDITMIGFSSASGSVNVNDGVLAAIFLRLAPGLTPGATYEVVIDLPNTGLAGPNGEPVVIEPRAGTLRVLAPGANKRLAIDDDRVPPGAFLNLGIQTLHPFPIGSGDVEVTWAAGFTVGTPQVTMDPRHGLANFSVDLSIPNRVALSFSSPDGSLNRVPGEIVAIRVQTDPTHADGTGPITLSGTSVVRDPLGATIPLVLVSGTIEIERRDAIFIDSFESGTTQYWTSSP